MNKRGSTYYNKGVEKKLYLGNLLNINNVFCVFSVRINNLSTPCHLINASHEYLRITSYEMNNRPIHTARRQIHIERNTEPEVAALPASSAYQKQDPTGWVQLSQYQTP